MKKKKKITICIQIDVYHNISLMENIKKIYIYIFYIIIYIFLFDFIYKYL